MRITDIKGIAPTNYKKSTLFLNKYRIIDILIMLGAFAWSFVWIVLLFFVLVPHPLSFIILVVIIPVTAIVVVQPLPNYHNILEYLMLWFRFRNKNKNFSNLIIRKKAVAENKKQKKKRKGK